MLSVQQKTSSMCITWVSASLTAETKRARMRVASNWSLGCYEAGSVFVFTFYAQVNDCTVCPSRGISEAM